MVERGGFEPPKAKPTDLQSAPFDRFGTSPAETSWAATFRPTVLNEKIKSDESPPSRSLESRDREGKPCGLAAGPPVFEGARASSAVRSVVVVIRTRCEAGL